MGKLLSKSQNERKEIIPPVDMDTREDEIQRESISAMVHFTGGLYCGDQGGVVTKFDVSNDQITDTWSVHTKAVTQIQCGDGNSIFTSSRDKNICKLPMNSSTEQITMPGHRLAITGLAVKADASKILSGGRDCIVVLWDGKTGREDKRMEVARNIVTDLCWIGDSTQAIQCSEDKIMKILDTRSMKVADSFPIKQCFQSCCHVDSECSQVVTGSVGGNGNGCSVTIWDIRQRKEVAVMAGHEQNVNKVHYFTTSSGLSRIISISADCSVRIWDPITQALACSSYIGGAQGLTCLDVLPNNTIYVGTLHGAIYKLRYDEVKETIDQVSII